MATITLMTGGLLHIAMVIQMLIDVRGQVAKAQSLVGSVILIQMRQLSIRDQAAEQRLISVEGRVTVETSDVAQQKRISQVLTLGI
jgi:hypothetical protein